MAEEIIQIHDKKFKLFIEAETIEYEVKELARRMNKELEGKQPIFLAVLNGAFFFAASLFRELHIPCEISFVKVASYEGTASTGTTNTLLGLDESLRGRTVVILEDIIDTGLTIKTLTGQLASLGAQEIKVATLILKPQALKYELKPDYVAFEAGEEFLVGYGLDYNKLGRNTKSIYQAID